MDAIITLVVGVVGILLAMAGWLSIVAGAWLAILGRWWAFGYAVAACFAPMFLLRLAMVPGPLFGAPAVVLMVKGRAGLAFPLQLRSTTVATRAPMATRKSSTLTFRIEPALKEALRTAAAREHRSIANMVEVLIRDYCGRNDIPIPEQATLFDEDRRPRASAPAAKRGRKA